MASPGSFGPWRDSLLDLSRHVSAKSSINVSLFEELPQGFDPVKRDYVLKGLKEGFRLRVVYPSEGRWWVLSHLSNASRARISENFILERSLGRMLGPFCGQPYVTALEIDGGFSSLRSRKERR